MQRSLGVLVIGVGANVLAAVAALAQGAPSATPEMTLSRLECGLWETEPTDQGPLGSPGLKVQLVYSCYLIKHGDDYMLWQTGMRKEQQAYPPKETVLEQLAKANLKPENIKYVGVSDNGSVHVDQMDLFPKSTLLIGKGNWDEENDPAKHRPWVHPKQFTPWIKGGSKVELADDEKDVFGDGTVVMLNMPAPSPEYVLQVKLKEKGYVLISNILSFPEEYSKGIPLSSNYNADQRARIAGTLDRFKKIAHDLNATVIFEHDARDIDKLPAFPASAK